MSTVTTHTIYTQDRERERERKSTPKQAHTMLLLLCRAHNKSNRIENIVHLYEYERKIQTGRRRLLRYKITDHHFIR